MQNVDVSRFVNLGIVPARRFFAATDSLAELTQSHGRRTFLAAFPSDRVLSIGLYQDAEIDLEEAASRYPWPMLRRSVGGHEVSVAPGSLLFSMIIPQDDAENSITRDHPRVQRLGFFSRGYVSLVWRGCTPNPP